MIITHSGGLKHFLNMFTDKTVKAKNPCYCFTVAVRLVYDESTELGYRVENIELINS